MNRNFMIESSFYEFGSTNRPTYVNLEKTLLYGFYGWQLREAISYALEYRLSNDFTRQLVVIADNGSGPTKVDNNDPCGPFKGEIVVSTELGDVIIINYTLSINGHYAFRCVPPEFEDASRAERVQFLLTHDERTIGSCKLATSINFSDALFLLESIKSGLLGFYLKRGDATEEVVRKAEWVIFKTTHNHDRGIM